MNKFIVWLSLIVILGGTIGFASSFVQSHQLTPCIQQWQTLTDEEKAACDERVGGRNAVLATRDTFHQQTVQALPSAPPLSGLATETADYAKRATPTPDIIGTVTTSSRERREIIKPVEPRETAGGGVPLSLDYRFMVSVWRVGALTDGFGMLSPFYVSTPSNNCSLITVTIGQGEDFPHTEEVWSCPQQVGELTIRGATGPTGIVTLTDTLDRTVTFNLATEEWTLAGAPWLP